MAFTYLPNIPKATDNPTESQSEIQSNFNALNVMNSRNHVALSDVNNSGRHVVVEMEEQSGNPAPTAGYGDVFVRDDGGTQNLYFQDDASNVVQLTGNFSAAANGWIIIMGNILINWGQSSTSSGTDTLTFPKAFGALGYQLSIVEVDGSGNGETFRFVRLSPSQARVTSSNSSSIAYSFIAIGTA